ncbi:hypothetical protein GF325_04570 [Candidatus Bathyarchaeota archaeon]|nr:hypothetical protein [Candidatus Bathyarchaeota archaeon]
MPKGIIIMEWSDRGGGDVISKFPNEVELSEATFMQIYANHDSEEDTSIISMMVGPLNLVSYFTGEENGYYIILILEMDEEGEVYEDALIDAGNIIVESINHDTIDMILSSIYHRISLYPKLNSEQLLALMYTSEIKRHILNRLERDGTINKGELNIWLKEVTGSSFIDIEAEVMRLAKYDLIKQATIRGFPTEVLFLMNILFITRLPPKLIIQEAVQRGMPQDILDEYKQIVTEYFKTYLPIQEDNKEICEIITEPACYEVLKLLRTSVVTTETLEKLKKKGVDDVQKTLNTMMKADLVCELKSSSGQVYYALKSNIRVQKVYPEHMINITRQAHKDHIKSPIVLIEHLKLLKESYLQTVEKRS